MATTSGTADRAPSLLPAGLTAPLGGPPGRRLRPSGAGPLARLAPVVLLLALPLSVAALRQAGCLTAGWQGRTPVWRQCASPLVESVQVADLGRGVTAWLTGSVRLDDPVLSGAVTSLLAGLAPGTGTGQQRWFLVLWMAFTAAVLAGLVVAVGTVRGHPHADPVALALSPVLALTVLLSADLVPVALAVVAVWAWSRGRTTLAGVLAGLALLAGPTSAVVLLALALVPPGEAEGATGRGRDDPRTRIRGTGILGTGAVGSGTVGTRVLGTGVCRRRRPPPRPVRRSAGSWPRRLPSSSASRWWWRCSTPGR